MDVGGGMYMGGKVEDDSKHKGGEENEDLSQCNGGHSTVSGNKKKVESILEQICAKRFARWQTRRVKEM